MKLYNLLLLLLCVVLCGCSTVTNRVVNGRDFDETKVSQIQKNVTTATGVVALYGEPDRKEIVSPQEVMWHYSYVRETHQTKNGLLNHVTEHTTGYKKQLDILFQNDIVINFTYVKVPVESEKETQSGL